MIEVFMLVGLVLCFNDILMQCRIEFVRRTENTDKFNFLTVASEKELRCNSV
jgi:hypothetical protein